MRITAAIAATALTLTTPAAPESELETLLDDVTATRTTSLDALEDAEGDDEVREILTEWRKDLIDAADTVAGLRENAGELTEDEEAEFDDAANAIKAERAGVRKLRAELLLDDDTVVVPTAAEELSGLYGTTFFDALERSEDGDVRIVYAIPGADTTTTEPTVTTEPTPAASNLRLRAAPSERAALQLVLNQEVSYAVLDEASLSLLLRESRFANLSIVGDIGLPQLLRLATRRDQPLPKLGHVFRSV